MSEKVAKKKIYKQEDEQSVDSVTGEILQKTSIKTSMIESEPSFVKLYIDDILKLKDVPKASNDVLNILVANMSYGNVVVMIKPIKDLIAEETGLKLNTINKAISNLHEAGILIRKNRGVYLVDPNLFAKGKWSDIKKLRLTIDYNADGTKEINSDAVEQLSLYQ